MPWGRYQSCCLPRLRASTRGGGAHVPRCPGARSRRSRPHPTACDAPAGWSAAQGRPTFDDLMYSPRESAKYPWLMCSRRSVSWTAPLRTRPRPCSAWWPRSSPQRSAPSRRPPIPPIPHAHVCRAPPFLPAPKLRLSHSCPCSPLPADDNVCLAL
jgi:hypothetical protein